MHRSKALGRLYVDDYMPDTWSRPKPIYCASIGIDGLFSLVFTITHDERITLNLVKARHRATPD